MRSIRPALLPLIVLAALALPASALGASFSAHLRIGSHQPKVGPQPITVTATRGRTKLSGTVSYRFLFNGMVVKTEPGGHMRAGVYHDKLLWPKDAVGHTITLQVVVKTAYGTDYLNWWIKVRA